MEIYKYESVEEVNHGLNKLEAIGYEIFDIQINTVTVKNTMLPKGYEFVHVFYVFVEKAGLVSTLEKSLNLLASSEPDDLLNN
jgi:hypothetical protein